MRLSVGEARQQQPQVEVEEEEVGRQEWELESRCLTIEEIASKGPIATLCLLQLEL